jgi:hypothetical protein
MVDGADDVLRREFLMLRESMQQSQRMVDLVDISMEIVFEKIKLGMVSDVNLISDVILTEYVELCRGYVQLDLDLHILIAIFRVAMICSGRDAKSLNALVVRMKKRRVKNISKDKYAFDFLQDFDDGGLMVE